MQKVLERTALAKAQATRRAAMRAHKARSAKRNLQRREEGVQRRMASQDIRDARVARREDRELGSLAPRRDVGEKKDSYASMDPRRLRGFVKDRDEREDAQPIVVGDRVVVVEGRDRGRIGQVKSVDRKRHECVVDGLNMVDVEMPKWFQGREGAQGTIQTMEAAIPLPSLRLVYALKDRETGQKRDVIVNKFEMRNVWFDRHLGIKKRYRVIAGLGVKVPWPHKDPKQHPEYDGDTLRVDVESQTWVPTLLTPPMPSSVIDELRNKYSKFRDRHEESYLAKKVAEDQAAARERKRLKMATITPLKEAQSKERREKRTGAKTPLTQEMLRTIGEVMAKKQNLGDGSAKEAASASRFRHRTARSGAGPDIQPRL